MNESSETSKMPQTSGHVAGQQQEHSNQNQMNQAKIIDNHSDHQLNPPVLNPSAMPINVNQQQQITSTTVNVSQATLTSPINESEIGNHQAAFKFATTNAIPDNFNISHQQQQQQLIQQRQYPQTKPLLTTDKNETDGHQAIQIDNTPVIQAQQQQTLLQQQPSQSQTTPQKVVVTKVRLADELNLFDWFKTDIISQIAEKAKNSVDSVITTLDPGMKEYLYSGGNVNILVITDSNHQVSSIRDAFQSVFGRATVMAASPLDQKDVADSYPIKTALGFSEAITVARERIRRLRMDTNNVPQNQVIVAVQPSIVSVQTKMNISITDQADLTKPDILPKWFFTYCMLIDDPVLSTTISSYSQLIPLEEDILDLARASGSPEGLPEKHLGFTASIHNLMMSKMKLSSQNESDAEYDCAWLQGWSGHEELQLIQQLGLTVANYYRKKYNECIS